MTLTQIMPRMIMKYNTFHSMNPIYGRERKFSKSTQYYNAMHNFLSDVNGNNHLSKDNLYVSFSNTSINSKIWFFQCFLKDKNNVFERKDYCSLSKKNSHYINEKAQNQIIKNQAITTQSTLSMKVKTKSKPMSLLNANGNFLPNQ